MECLGMIKCISASALVVLAVASCQQMNEKEGPQDTPEVVINNVDVTKEKELSYEPRVINVNEVRFMPPEERKLYLGTDWNKNKSLADYIDPSEVGIKVDMSKDRKIDLKYTTEFALNVSAKNSKGHGSVSISSQWWKKGTKVSFEAISDNDATFVRWEGDIKDGVEIEGNEVSLVMSKPRTIFAVFASNKNELTIDSTYGDPKGAGIYDRGKSATWSVTSPFNISDSERVVAPVTEGTFDLEDDKTIKIQWEKEYILKTLSDDMGSVKGGNIWAKKDSEATLEAVAADETIGFVRWEGVDPSVATQNPLTLKMAKSYLIKAVFAKQKYTLNVVTEHGEANGTGLHPTGSDAKWSVTANVPTDDENVRLAASPASGLVKITGNKTINVKWVKEFKVQVFKNNGTEETAVEELWVKEGENLKGYNLKFPAESTDKVYSWSGKIPRENRGIIPLTFKVTEPTKIVANLVPIKSALTVTNNIDENTNSSEHLHTEIVNIDIQNITYPKDPENPEKFTKGIRAVLDKTALKDQVEDITVKEKKVIKVENSSNIQVIDFAGWKNCVRIKTAFAQVIVSPEAGRVVYFGSPDNKTNLLWLNEDYIGEKTSKAQATEDWSDKGGSRVWVAPLQARPVLTGKSFPPAFEIDGAPYQNTIINGNIVTVQNFANADYGCKIQRTFELKKNKLYINTSLVKTSDTKHHYLLGPLMLTQFVRPNYIRFIKSAQPKDHELGYANIKGKGPEIKVDELDDSRFKIKVPESYNDDWTIGSYTSFAQMEFKGYILNSYAKFSKNSVFPEKNCNLTIFAPEAPTDYIEVGNYGELYEISDTKRNTQVIWELEKR
jgi:hypothetical protein